jgi:hypothetical protein
MVILVRSKYSDRYMIKQMNFILYRQDVFPILNVDTRYLVSQYRYTQRCIAVKRRGLSSARSISAGLKATPRHAMPKALSIQVSQ